MPFLFSHSFNRLMRQPRSVARPTGGRLRLSPPSVAGWPARRLSRWWMAAAERRSLPACSSPSTRPLAPKRWRSACGRMMAGTASASHWLRLTARAAGCSCGFGGRACGRAAFRRLQPRLLAHAPRSTIDGPMTGSAGVPTIQTPPSIDRLTRSPPP